jgi:Bacterial membrane protein YfhO
MDASNAPRQIIRSGMIRLSLWFCAYVVLGVALLGANPFRGETTGPFDLLAAHPGWKADEAPVSVRNRERSDILDALVPEWTEARRQIREGIVPLWNPLRAGGDAGLLDPTNAQLTVPFAVYAASPDPALGFYLAILSSLVIAGLGMHLLVARHCGPLAALFAGISYMACGFITAWLFWPHAQTAILVPWLLLAVGSFASTGSLRSFAGIALATAMLFLGGFPFVVAIGFGAALVHASIMATRLDGRSMLLRPAATAAAMALGLVLVAIPLLTMLSDFAVLDLGYRRGGSAMTLELHRQLLWMPWAGQEPHVESNMYVGRLALVFALFGLASLFGRSRSVLAWTGMACFFSGAILVFGILPRDIGRHLPVLSSNPWGRAILLMDIGLILLAAVGVDQLVKKIRWGYVALVVGIALCVLQGIDLRTQFRQFNGPTPAKYFYPVSHGLAVLQDTIRPFQYAGQDSSYFLQSGTLGTLGIGEWYAHALRTPQLHNLLDAMAEQPFSSHSATAITISDFHWSDDLTDAVGLCYAVYPSKTGLRELIATSRKSRKNVALPPINNIELVQPIRVAKVTRLTSVAIKLATYRAMDVDGQVTVMVRTASDGVEIARSTLAAAEVLDNRMAFFPFPAMPMLSPGVHDLVITYVPGPNKRNLTAWLLADVPGKVLRAGKLIPGSLQYAILGPLDPSLEAIAEGDGVTVAKNTGCVDGAYWTADLTAPLSSRQGGAARLQQYVPHHFRIRSQAKSPGYVIVPMQYQEGWQVRVDGRAARMRLVKGVLPAVAVPAGSAEVTFAYRPPHWQLGLAISGTAILTLVGLWGVGTRRRKRQAKTIEHASAHPTRPSTTSEL